jgi:hypothetical protein|tara:strand:+ start:20 stop:220 length:201 start_codon:yes stop_codon:yes gene_type:complete
MIIRIEYDKSKKTLVLTKDEDKIVADINDNTVVDDSNNLSFEIALDVSQYQKQFEEDEINIDGNDN